jgi:hypothetical protein
VAQTRRFLFLVFGLAMLLVPARSAVLIHSYTLRGTLADAQGGPALTAFGGQITSLGYVFAANQGLLFSSPLFTPANFSLEFSFKFESPTGYDKIADFSQLSSDSGFYQRDGQLNFYNAVSAAPLDFLPGTTVHVVLTRDSASNLVSGYVNGQSRFSFVDTGSLAVTSGTLNFFVDDLATAQSEASAGTVSSIRIYNGALTASEVASVFTAGQPPLAIPEPSTTALLVVGSFVVLFAAHRRRKQL